MPNTEERIAKEASSVCPKCNGPRKISKLNISGNSYLYVNFGGRIRNRDSHKLYAVGCKNCNYVEIYAD